MGGGWCFLLQSGGDRAVAVRDKPRDGLSFKETKGGRAVVRLALALGPRALARAGLFAPAGVGGGESTLVQSQ